MAMKDSGTRVKPQNAIFGGSCRQWSRKPGFNPWSHHTKDFKNDTWYLLA